MLLVLYTASSGVVVRCMLELLPFWRAQACANNRKQLLPGGGMMLSAFVLEVHYLRLLRHHGRPCSDHERAFGDVG